jgi:hypothetical protein
MSASYAPKQGTQEHAAITGAIEALFAEHAGANGTVGITYTTVAIAGRPRAGA